MQTPTLEPDTITAGDSLTWTRTFTDYPATDGWTLKYCLTNASARIDIAAAASGSAYLVNVPTATTAAYAAGVYDWVSWLERPGQRITLLRGRITVKPDFAATPNYDARSFARKVLESLQAAALDYISKGSGHVQEYKIAGREMKFRSNQELQDQIDYWQNKVNEEERKLRASQGQPVRTQMKVRF